VLASNLPYSLPFGEACEKAAKQSWRPNRGMGARDWPALTKLNDKLDPSYRE
jgi:hypothetical protein